MIEARPSIELSTVALLAALLSFPFGTLTAAEDSASGAELYEQQCSKCHGQLAGRSAENSATPHVVLAAGPAFNLAFALPYGPSLVNILGRAAGTLPDYDYSAAFLGALNGVVWDADSLDVYLTNTQARAPGTRMYYEQPDTSVRRTIITYLANPN